MSKVGEKTVKSSIRIKKYIRFKKFPDSCGRDLGRIHLTHVRIVVPFPIGFFLSLKEIPPGKYDNYTLMLQMNSPLLGGLHCNMENGCCR